MLQLALQFFWVAMAFASPQPKDEQAVALFISQGLAKHASSQSLDLTIRIPKSFDRITYIPQLSLFFTNNTIDRDQITGLSSDRNKEITGSMIGIKAGVSLPVKLSGQIAIYPFSSLSFARTSVQSDPWFGQPNNSLDEDKMHQLNVGVRIRFQKYLIGYTYSISDLDYLKTNQSLSLGVLF